MAVEFGNLNYDIPNHRKSLYKRLRDKTRQKALMLTWSCYLIPWGMCEEVSKIIDKFNQDKDGTLLPAKDRVKFNIFKYDEVVSGQNLANVAGEAMAKMISRTKSTLIDKVQKALEGEVEDPDGSDDAFTTARAAAAKARKTLEDVQALTLLFGLTDQMEAGLVAFTGFIEAQYEHIKAAQERIKAATKKSAASKPQTKTPTTALVPASGLKPKTVQPQSKMVPKPIQPVATKTQVAPAPVKVVHAVKPKVVPAIKPTVIDDED
jgi:hypothetical protein